MEHTQRWLGFPSIKLLVVHLSRSWDERRLRRIRPLVDRVSRGETVRYESDAPFRAGGPDFLQVVYTPWRELDGTVNGWVASVTDITLLRKAQEGLRKSENRLRAITDNLPHCDRAV